MTRTAVNPIKSNPLATPDRNGFSRTLEPYRRELIAYCYRLTGSLSEAEDMTQEAFLRAFKARETFEGRATPRAWLYKIAHNLCVNHVQRRPAPWQSLDEHVNLPAAGSDAEAASLSRESVRLGFVALVQSLPPKQRAALVLRDVLGWSAEDAARILETTVPAVKNALARARETLAKQAHTADSLHDMADPAAQELVGQWADAFEKGNTARMVSLLTETDKQKQGPPAPQVWGDDALQSGVDYTKPYREEAKQETVPITSSPQTWGAGGASAGYNQNTPHKTQTHGKETKQERPTHGKQ